MLWDLKPKTIIELGSGTGASAVWMADHLKILGVPSHIYSVDLQKSPLQHDLVTFFAGDCHSIESAFPADLLRSLPHPWLVIEDAHENVLGVLRYFSNHLRIGDYLVVEDSEPSKESSIGKFILEHPDAYAVDTHYTDFFGHNATCSVDSILKKVQ
jgi:cephalosporin hydroxylase